MKIFVQNIKNQSPKVSLSTIDKGNIIYDIQIIEFIFDQKYGIGYILSDGAVGVYFNDNTKLILDHRGE